MIIMLIGYKQKKNLSDKDLRNFMSNFELVNKKLKQRKRSVLVEHSNI